MDGVQLERAHHVGPIPSLRDEEAPKHRSIVARFCWFSDLQQALRNSPKLRKTNIFLNEDLYFASAQERKAQLPELRRARAEGKIAYFVHTRLVIREKRMETSRTTGAHDSPNQLTIPAATNTVVTSDDGGAAAAAAELSTEGEGGAGAAEEVGRERAARPKKEIKKKR